MLNFNEITAYLKDYDEEPISLMEVCGTHTAAIAKCGLRSMLSDKIKLVSGPGCPVCVTVSAYIDKLCALSLMAGNTVVTFGDMMRVHGSQSSLNEAKSSGASVQMVYSPFDILKLAADNPNITYIFAAIGFETTTPIYALLLEQAIAKSINNIKLLTSLKTMPAALSWICSQNSKIDGFIAPGHVSVMTGSEIYHAIAEKYNLPFAIAGFDGEQILAAIYTLIKQKKSNKVVNLYRSAVNENANLQASALIKKYFVEDTASWRGIGNIAASGLYLKEQYNAFDAGSFGLDNDNNLTPQCRCGEILIGNLSPNDCPLFGKACMPQNPKGACMVSEEGACFTKFSYERN